MEAKIKLIDRLCEKHPALGVDRGWSEYTVGMKDTGQWFFRKMLDEPIGKLQELMNEIVRSENLPLDIYTPEELSDMKKTITLNGYFISVFEKKKLDEFRRELEADLFGFGIFTDTRKKPSPRIVTVEQALNHVSVSMGIPVKRITIIDRLDKKALTARQVFAAVAVSVCKANRATIAYAAGWKTHVSVITALRAVKHNYELKTLSEQYISELAHGR